MIGTIVINLEQCESLTYAQTECFGSEHDTDTNIDIIIVNVHDGNRNLIFNFIIVIKHNYNHT